jgi:O-antigen ligase
MTAVEQSSTATVDRGVAAAQLLLAGLAAAVAAQGGYHASGRWPLVVLLPAALACVLPIMMTAPRSALLDPPLLAALALAVWAAVRGIWTGDPASGLPTASLSVAVAVLLAVGGGLRDVARAVVLRGVLAIAVGVALTGWAGVVWHVDRLAVSQDGVWRAASTLSYPNAAAALLTVAALPALAVLTTRPTDRLLVLATTVLLVGHAATLSRAGALSLAAGASLLVLVGGWRRAVRAAVAPVLGAAVAVVGLAGSFPLTSQVGRWTAVLALVGALVLAVVAARVTWPPVLVLVAGAGFALWATAATVATDVGRLRFGAGSADRVDAHRAALRLVAEHPAVGVGPGHGPLDLGPVGRPLTSIRFVHDEYVQVLLDLGVVGLMLLLLLVALLVRAAATGSRVDARDLLPVGVLAALVAAAVHGGLDFVWHVPVVPLTAVALVAVVRRPASDP